MRGAHGAFERALSLWRGAALADLAYERFARPEIAPARRVAGGGPRALATGSKDRTVRLWDIESQQAVGTPLAGPGRGVGAVAPYFTPDGTALITSYDTGRAYRWDISPESLALHACRIAGRRLTRAEWTEFLPGRDYDPAC